MILGLIHHQFNYLAGQLFEDGGRKKGEKRGRYEFKSFELD
jgi:hypothetical protein